MSRQLYRYRPVIEYLKMPDMRFRMRFADGAFRYRTNSWNFVEVEASSVGSVLTAMSAGNGLPELAAPGDDIARLARLILCADQVQTAKLPNDVYAMY